MVPGSVGAGRPVHVAVVYPRGPVSRATLHAMDTLLWLRVAEGLADVGFAVDLIAFSYYLRTGLPVVSEAPIPNNRVIEEARCGLIAPYGDDDTLAEMVEAAARRPWDRARAVRYVLAFHTWDRRMQVYQQLFAAEFGA